MKRNRNHWMRLALIGLVFALALFGLARSTAPTTQAQSGGTLGYGSKVFGSISAVTPSVAYSFTAVADDFVTVIGDSWTGALDLQIELVAPNGVVLNRSAQNALDGDPMGAYLSVVLPDAGIYVLRLSGENNTVGDYLLTLLGRPAVTSAPLVYGQALDVTVPPNAPPQFFAFDTDDCPTTLLVSDISAGQPLSFPFVVKVRDQRGLIVALLRGGEQVEDWVTVAPRSGRYEVEVLSADPTLEGSLRLLVTCSGDNPHCAAGQAGIMGIPGADECRACPGGSDLIGGGGCPDLNLRVEQGLHMADATTVFWDAMPGADGYTVYVYGLTLDGGEVYLTHADWMPGDPTEFTWILPTDGYAGYRFALQVLVGEVVVCSQQALQMLEHPDPTGVCEVFTVSVRALGADMYEWSWTPYPDADSYILNVYGVMADGSEEFLATSSAPPDMTCLTGGIAIAPFEAIRLEVGVVRDGWLICVASVIVPRDGLPTVEPICPEDWPISLSRVDDATVMVAWGTYPGATQYLFWVENESGVTLPGYPVVVTGNSITLPTTPDMYRFLVGIVDPTTGAIICSTDIAMPGQQVVPPCVVITDRGNVTVHVGPGRGRGVFGYLEPGVEYAVVGQAVDDEGNPWWQIDKTQFAGHEAVTSLWVAQSDVTAIGDCAQVPQTDVPPVIPGDDEPPPGGWLPCGSCDTCGHPANECVTSPEGVCLWDPATCAPGPVPTVPPPGDDEQCYTINVAIDMTNCQFTSGSAMLDIMPNCDGGRYTAGTTMQAHAVAVDPKCQVDYWSGCGASGGDNSVTFTANSNCTLTAHMHYGN
jgi:hypothetical protein